MSNSVSSTPRSPGSYRHPAMDELQRIHQKTGNKGENIRTIVQNFAALVLSFILPSILQSYKIINLDNAPYLSVSGMIFLAVCAARFVFIGNIIYCIGNLRQTDSETRKLALTPQQRRLMGVDPKAVADDFSPSAIETPPRKPKTLPKSLITSPGFDATPGAFPSIIPRTTSPLRRAEQESRASFGAAVSRAAATTSTSFGRNALFSPNNSILDTPSPVTMAHKRAAAGGGADPDGPVVSERWRYEKLARRGESLLAPRAVNASVSAWQ